jgi:hypothetical protein
MKTLLVACALMSLQWPGTAAGYEADIHYSTTYVLARAVGWSEDDARTIASANQGVDENQDTVAALEVDASPGLSLAGYLTSNFRQAEKNLRFHCFSRREGSSGGIAEDVVNVMAGHFAAVPAPDGDSRKNARRLIALGVALHCQQDAHAHADFGGSCGPHAGSCFGHTRETILDNFVFELLGTHYFNPDHPGVSGARLLETLKGSMLALAAHRQAGASRPIPLRDLAALAGALETSGLELPDDMRRECNRHLAGKWLHDFLRSRGRVDSSVTRLAPAIATTCRNPSLASAAVARIPDPHFPRLTPDASPRLVRADGTYQRIREGSFADALPAVRTQPLPSASPNYPAHRLKVQLSHWSQILALPLTTRLAYSPAVEAQAR